MDDIRCNEKDEKDEKDGNVTLKRQYQYIQLEDFSHYKTNKKGQIFNDSGKRLGQRNYNRYTVSRLTRRDGSSAIVYVHRLVYFQQVSPFDPKLTIYHINGDTNDNRVENLDIYGDGVSSPIIKLKGGKNLKLGIVDRNNISKMYTLGFTVRQIMERYKTTQKTIRSILTGKVYGGTANDKYIKEVGFKPRGANLKSTTDEDIQKMVNLYQQGVNPNKIGRLTGFHRCTVVRYLTRHQLLTVKSHEKK